MPVTRADTGHAPATKRQKRGQRPQLSKSDKSDIANGTHSNAAQAGPIERMPHHFHLLYKVSCNKSHTSRHPAPAFRDAPILNATHESRPGSSTRLHLNGTIPVLDLEAFMEDDTDDFAFVAIRTVECSEASVLMVQAGHTLPWTEAIYTKSKILKNAMQQIATCHFLWSSTTESFERNRIAPADLFLFHHRHLLRTYALKHPESTQHVDALFEYVDNRYGVAFAEAENLFARGLITQAHIFYLFKPNELVISGTYGRPAAFVLQEWPKLDNDGWLTLYCWSFQTDGSGFARKRSTLSIPPIESETTKIQNLHAYPLRFATPELRELVRSRGEKQWDLRSATQITYKGWNVKGDQFFPDARFMIDHKIYRKMHEYAQTFQFERPKTTHPFDRMPAYLSAEQEPSDIDFLLMPPDIHGFYLNEKKWLKLFVDCVQPVSWNKKAYERLVLPPQTKDLVRALVAVRTSQRGVKQGLGVAGKRTDITSGKGNGLIMLLHGGPGTGKTLTAESVAEIAEMPLYRVTCGDIGTNAEAVEKYLNTVLHLGKAWNCVLLLDEADVFLEERSMADLKRNSLVSVFLRILEYYDGILILTSNRVGMFDEAFKSRIQVALHYENLNRSARKKIWQNFLEMLEEDEEDVNFDEIKLHLDDLAGKDLNGRQIRNVLTTARQLAIFRNERLDWEHLEQALSVSSDFNEYLKRMQGHTDDQRARDIGLR